MPSDTILPIAARAGALRDDLSEARGCGGITVQEHSAMGKLTRALEAFLDEVGA